MIELMIPQTLLASVAASPRAFMMLPFGLMLLSMAAMPLLMPSIWSRSYRGIALGLGSVCAIYYVFVLGAGGRLLGVAGEYISFIVFIGSLYTVAGGIHIQVKGEAKPTVNCLYLLIGALLANLIGTTGASMLLIRPWIRMNKYRFTNFHTAFFIFIISNVGGCLTPIGDPPLFLGYLQGVPFWWVTQRCFPAWALALTCLLTVFYLVDRFNFVQAPRRIREMETANNQWRFDGARNLFFLALILAAVFINRVPGLRETVMALAAYGSYRTTAQSVHHSNDFSFAPIKEIAWLFAGIFGTMAPALDYLQNNAVRFGIKEPWQYYWFSGALSSVLDNAPTYLTFSAAALGLKHMNLSQPGDMARFLTGHGNYIVAVSLGSVFFGAMTYIGNGPNLMVKAIADQSGVHTPHFFAYILKYSVVVLLPVLALVSYIFFPIHLP